MANLTVLGEEELLTAFTLQGVVDGFRLLEVMRELITEINMTPDGVADIRQYPTADGKGGTGWQIYQPLTESWVVAGTWPALKVPVTRVVVSSCKPYDPEVVVEFLQSKIGKVIKWGAVEL